METSVANSQAPTGTAIHAVPAQTSPRIGAESHSLGSASPFRIFHLASLDAPTVAVVWALAFAWAASVHLPLWAPIALWLVAWTLYIADRLLDARPCRDCGAGNRFANASRLQDRHHFHWRHRRVLGALAAASAIAAAVLVFAFMPSASMKHNSILAAATIAYFTGVHTSPALSTRRLLRFPRISKELLVGLLFTAGCALPAWSRIPGFGLSWTWLLPITFFALLGWLDCYAIERWEANGTAHSKPQILLPAVLLGSTGLMLCFVLASTHPRQAALLVAGLGSVVLLALLDGLQARLSPLALRAAADLVLLTPLALLWR